MSSYIVCQKKRNNPRMDIRICQKKCTLKDDCEEYQALQKPMPLDKDIHLSAEPQSGQIGLALDTIS